MIKYFGQVTYTQLLPFLFSIQRIEKQYIYVENMKRTGQADSATENDKLKSIKNKKMIKATRKKK